MRSDQHALVEKTFRLIAPLCEMASAVFYQHLFALDPALSRLFRHANMDDQGREFMAAVGFVVDNLRRPDTLLPVVAELGRRHARYGVQPAHYASVGSALLLMLAEGLGDSFTPAVRDAWGEAYGLLSGVMQDAASTSARAA